MENYQIQNKFKEKLPKYLFVKNKLFKLYLIGLKGFVEIPKTH